MTVKYNQNGELTMDGISLKRLRKALVHLPLFMMNYKLENRCAVTIAHLKIVDWTRYFIRLTRHLLAFKWSNL